MKIGFIGHFNTRLVSTFSNSAIADIHTLQITRAHTKCFPACSVFSSRFPVTASNSGNFSASALTLFLAGHRLTTQLSSQLAPLVTPSSIVVGQLLLQRRI
jgi:hypothetical protein